MKRPAALAITLWASVACASPIWVETFDDGVGRFDQTLGPGDVRHVWQPSQQLRAFIVQDDKNDRRFADLEQTFDAQSDVIGFAVQVRPVAATDGDNVSSGVGFWNSANDYHANHLGLNFGIGDADSVETGISITGRYADGSPVAPSAAIPFDFFTTYYIDLLVNLPAHSVIADVYQGPDATGTLLGTLSTILDPGKSLMLDSLGMGAVAPGGEAIVLFLDNFAFTIPEPTTLALLALTTTALLPRRRR